jgi:hypothetical protein
MKATTKERNRNLYLRAEYLSSLSNQIDDPIKLPGLLRPSFCPQCYHWLGVSTWLLHPLGLYLHYFKCTHCRYEYAREA